MKQYNCNNCAKLYSYDNQSECTGCKQEDGERVKHESIGSDEDFQRVMDIIKEDK